MQDDKGSQGKTTLTLKGSQKDASSTASPLLRFRETGAPELPALAESLAGKKGMPDPRALTELADNEARAPFSSPQRDHIDVDDNGAPCSADMVRTRWRDGNASRSIP